MRAEDKMQGDQKIRKKLPTFSKNSPKSCQAKKGQNVYNKAQFEGPKHLQKRLLKPLNTHNKPCFETAYLCENLINLLKLKVAQKVAIIFGYFILSNNHNEPSKVAQLEKNDLICHPD
jgi:hypothetical protein